VFVNPTSHTGNGDDGACGALVARADTYAAAMLGGDTETAGCTPTVYLVDMYAFPS
jgi:hypothetical protein